MLRRFTASLLLAAFAFSSTAFAAQDSPAPTAVFHVRHSIVLLDVVVVDTKGKPVTDLKREEFQVFEDKQPQRINSFEPPAVHELPTPKHPDASFNPDDTASFGQSPVTILVLDELNTHFSDTDFARRAIRDFLNARPKTLNEPTMLVSLGDKKFSLLQNFTRDRDVLLASLASHTISYSWKLEIGAATGSEAAERLGLSINALEQLAQYTARIPGRKNMVWVGKGFPTLDPEQQSPDQKIAITAVMQHVTDTMLRTRVTLYAVDPTSSAIGNTSISDEDSFAVAQFAGDNGGGYTDPFNSGLDFDRLGPMTGGRVLRGRNDVGNQIEDSVQLGEKFYTLGYTPINQSETEAKYRKIKVVCTRPGTMVITRDGYYPGAGAREQGSEIIGDDLNAAVSAELLYTALRIRVEPAGSGLYSIHVAAPGLSWSLAGDGTNKAQAEVLGVSLSAKGKVLSHTLHTMTATAAATANVRSPSLPADFTIDLTRPKGTTKMRFVVRDTTTGQMGSFDLILP